MIIKLAPAVIIGALLSFPVAVYSADTAKQIVKDSVITTKIKAEQAKDKLVRAMKIHVETDNSGMVVLSGNARSQAEIDRAVEIAKGVQGVTSVQNNMTLGAAPAETTRTTGDTSMARPPRADRN